jgi:hypothetical protein
MQALDLNDEQLKLEYMVATSGKPNHQLGSYAQNDACQITFSFLLEHEANADEQDHA